MVTLCVCVREGVRARALVHLHSVSWPKIVSLTLKGISCSPVFFLHLY